MLSYVLTTYILASLILFVDSENKYSKEANQKPDEPLILNPTVTFRTLDKPFRMAKLNMLWSKAQRRLTDTKLKSLFSDLKIHDKEELAWKKLKADGSDKDGLKEAEIREKLIGIMSTYGLLEHFQDINDPQKLKAHKALNDPSNAYINKSLFKDKRLNQIWEKAEKAGFTAEELKALHEEFDHHQEKIDQFYSLMNELDDKNKDKTENSIDEKLDRFNLLSELEEKPDKQYQDKANSLRDLHYKLKDGFDRLDTLAAKGPNSREFIEPKVQGLWRLAVESNFSNDELESLKSELLHYENRLLKLRHLHAEAELNPDRRSAKLTGHKPSEGLLLMEETIKKQERKVEKLRLELETRIMQKHIEL